MLNKGETPISVNASVFPVFIIALINIARICLERIKKRNKSLKYKADREKKFLIFKKINASINTHF